MKKAVFTIVAKNYFGLAEVLGESIRKVNPEVDFYIFIADELDDDKTKGLINSSKFLFYVCKDVLGIENGRWYDNAFKYSVTEFCTYIKPYCFNVLLNKEYDKVIYFDPDIYVFNSLDGIFNELDDAFVVVTPHITTMEVNYTGDGAEEDFMSSGIYNLGFLGIKSTEESRQLLNWWANRLENKCYVDKASGLFTDQKWIDFIFSFFDKGIHISRSLGRNIAPWNFYERKLELKDERLYVSNRINNTEPIDVTFIHYSGFNYKNFADSNLNHPNVDFNKYSDILISFKLYEQKVSEGRIAEFFNLKYSYNYFDNKIEILHIHRRFYRRVLAGNKLDITQPFLAEPSKSFYNQLLNKNLVDAKYIANSVDKLPKQDFDNLYRKTIYINKFFFLIKRFLGFKKYYLLAKFFTKYFKIENQFFLFDPKDVIKPN